MGWIDVFSRQSYKEIIIDSFQYCQKHKGLHINAFVIMTNHIHLVAHSPDNNLSNIIREFKKFTSKRIIESIQENSKESRSEWMLDLFRQFATSSKKHKNYQFWTHNNHPVELFSPKWINQKIIYTHNNPVNAGIVEMPEHYTYSSAKNYIGQPGILDVEVIDVDSTMKYFIRM
jgi:REP element-mobilizing transposase RayT